MYLKSKKGFTLIELIMVIVIIGVLAAVAIPAFGNLVRNAREGATQGSLGAIRSAVAIFFAQTAVNGDPVFPTLIQMDGALFANGVVPENALTGASDFVALVPANAAALDADNGWAYDAATGRVWAYTDDDDLSDTFAW